MSQKRLVFVFFFSFPIFLLLILHATIHWHWHFRGKKASSIPNSYSLLFLLTAQIALETQLFVCVNVCMWSLAFCVSYCKAYPSKTVYSVSLTCIVHTSYMKLWASDKLAPQKLCMVCLQVGWQTMENSVCVVLKGNKCHSHFSVEK